MVKTLEIEHYQIAGETIRLQMHEHVWAPTDFAHLFAEHLTSIIDPGHHALEIGVGSGILSVFAGLKGASLVGTDINPHTPDLCERNWALNGLDRERSRFLQSDLFTALTAEDVGAFDVVWCNAPTFPGHVEDRVNRRTRVEYEQAGDDGREIVDSIIKNSKRFLKPGGTMLTVVTSKQGWRATEALLEACWNEWTVAHEKELVLADHYFPFIEYWLDRERQDGEQRIYQKNGQWYQRLLLLKAHA